MIQINLSGRKAFVTGGSRGIGAAICRAFAECGADVAFTYKTNKEAAELLLSDLSYFGGMYLAIQASADDEEAMTLAVEKAAQKFDGLDILVANVAGGKKASLSDLTMADWRQGLEINLTSAFLAVKLAHPFLCKASRGDVILIGSSAAYDGGGPVPYYATAKEGMVGLTRFLMREFSQKNIRINTVHPCVVDTDGLRQGHGTEEKLNWVRSQVPLGRLSKVEDVSNLVAFLCSPLCEFVTGQSILVDGGRTLWKKTDAYKW